MQLTRMVVDEEWDRKVWKEAWEPRVVQAEEEGIRAGEIKKAKKREEDGTTSKRMKIDQEVGKLAWGDADTSIQESRKEFLYTGQVQERAEHPLKQSTLQPLTGIEWLSRKIMEELIKRAAEIGEWCLEAQAWEEWEPITPGRSRKEEMWLWK